MILQVSKVKMMMLTTTRMLVVMVVVKVVMMTVMTRRMTTTTKYGLRDRGHELFLPTDQSEKNRSRLPATNGGSTWAMFGAGPKWCEQYGVSLPGYWKGIGDRFEGVLVGIGEYWRVSGTNGR